jgi:hypothetical protein
VAAKKAATLAGGGINLASLFPNLIYPIAGLSLGGIELNLSSPRRRVSYRTRNFSTAAMSRVAPSPGTVGTV